MKKRTTLVTNDGTAKTHIQSLVLNLLPKLVRHDTMENRNFLVVPMVILTEGVHAGSDGPMYYPKDELSKTPVVWNHKPVVVYHPEMNGVGISACDPSVITNRKVGVMMNTKFEKGKLRSEAWIEVDRANAVDERIMAAIENNQMMELSTGVFVDCEDTQGEWKGEEYIGIARNYRPDHLALLPDKIGACSIKDGAGFLRNSKWDPQLNAKTLAAFQRMASELGISNEMSHSNINDSLRAALTKKFNINMDKGPFLWLSDVYDDFVIYELDGKLFRLGYSAADTGVTLSEEAPVPVVRVTEYRTADGSFVGNQGQTNNKPNKSMNKKQLVDAIITANAGWKEEDREALTELTEAQLQSMLNLNKEFPTANFTMEKTTDGKVNLKVGSPKAPAAGTQNAPTPEPKKVEPVVPVANAQPKVLNLQEYIAAAPPEVQAVLNNSLQVYDEEKAKLIESIVANKNNPFTKEDLNNRPLGELRGLARLAGVNTPTTRTQAHYAGQGMSPETNAEQEEALTIPSMSFTK